jgi:hypothetical protein
MLIRSEDGNIYNLDHAYEVVLESTEEGYAVVAHFNLESSSSIAGARHEMAWLTQPKPEAEARAVMDRIIQQTGGNLDLIQSAEVRSEAYTPTPGSYRAPSP